MSSIGFGLAVLLAYPSGEEVGYFLVQMISACLPLRREGGLGVGTLCSGYKIRPWKYLDLSSVSALLTP
jgi:hypothetical protein